ncbi:MAG: biopolymer transporter ExbD [Verrucomicrobiia bacterium]
MAGGGGGEEGEFGLQIAPMLDVMFVLLLFFMVSAGVVAKEAELGVQVPGRAAPGAPRPASVPVTIEIMADGAVRFNQAPIDSASDPDLPQLRARLRALVEADEKQAVIIRPSGDVRHERLVDVLNACSWSGVTNLSFGGG